MLRLYTPKELEHNYESIKNICLSTRNTLYLTGPYIELNNPALTYENTKNIERLFIRGYLEESLDTDIFTHCSNLKYVTIMDTNIRYLKLEFLQDKEIKELFIHTNRIEEINLTPLEKMYQLECLDLSGNNFKKLDLEFLSNLKRIKKLDVSSNMLSEIDLSIVQESRIEIIGITTFAQEIRFDFEKLYTMKKLNHIRYSCPRFNGEEVRTLIEQKKPVTYIKKVHLFIPDNKELNYRCRRVETKNLFHEIWNEEEFDSEDNPMIYVINEIYKEKQF